MTDTTAQEHSAREAHPRRSPTIPGNDSEPTAVKLSRILLIRGKVGRKPGIDKESQCKALASILTIVTPDSDHGRLLALALSGQHAKTAPGKPADVIAVRWLLARAIVPTESAVAARVRETKRYELREARTIAMRQEANKIVATDGQRAALYVAERIAETDEGPTWNELSAAMTWPYRLTGIIISGLRVAGWLACTDQYRSLRPGARHAVTSQPACRQNTD